MTLSLLYMTVLSVFGRQVLPEGTDSVALPFAGLFALPSVRGVMPGNPPFGETFPAFHILVCSDGHPLRLSDWYENKTLCCM